MQEKRLFDRIWFSYGKLSGFGIGFQITKYQLDLNLGFWFIGLEY